MSLAIIVLTHNEELHLERCLKSLIDVSAEVFVVDSYSSDKTEDIAKKYNAHFVQNAWTSHAGQLNWAIENCPIQSDWVMRVDADEFLSKELSNSISRDLDKISAKYSGIRVKRLMYFMDKPLRKGGMYPIWHLKLWRRGHAYCEQKWMDERMVLSSGDVTQLNGDLIDHNLNNLTWWTTKHNGYATREAIDILDKLYGFTGNVDMQGKLLGTSEERRRWLKQRYLKMPLFIRPFLFFFIRYFLQLGFLEGKRGFVWSILQCFWYRYLVDAKIEEVRRKAGNSKEDIIQFFQAEYGINVTKI